MERRNSTPGKSVLSDEVADMLVSDKGKESTRDPIREQEVLEEKLQKLLLRSQELLHVRRSAYTLKPENKEAFTLPTVSHLEFLPPGAGGGTGLELFRRQRFNEIATLSEVPHPDNLVIDADILREEVEAAMLNETDPRVLHARLLQFQSDRRSRLQNKKFSLLSRWSRYCRSQNGHNEDGGEKVRKLFEARLQAVEEEYDDACIRTERLQANNPPAAVRDRRESVDVSVADPPFIAESTGEGDKVGITYGIEPEDVAIYLRWLVYHRRSLKRPHRMFKKYQWSIYSHRQEIYKKSVQALESLQGSSLQTSVPTGTDIPLTIPLMVTSAAKMDELLALLCKYFKIDVRLDKVDGGQELLYHTNKLFADTFLRQNSVSHYPEYGLATIFNPSVALSASASTLSSATQQQQQQQQQSQPSLAPSRSFKLMSMAGNKSGVDVSASVSSSIASTSILPQQQQASSASSSSAPTTPLDSVQFTENLTHLKQSKWLPFVQFRPDETNEHQAQESILRQITKVDHSLRVENGFVASRDLAFVIRRLKEQAESHVDRTRNPLEQAPSDLAGFRAALDAKKAHQAAKERASASSPTTPLSTKSVRGEHPPFSYAQAPALLPNKLLSLYFLRFLRIRDYKHRLLSILNYFRSVERMVTLDLAQLSRQVGRLNADTPEEVALSQWIKEENQPHFYLIRPPASSSQAQVADNDVTGVQNASDEFEVDASGSIHVRDSYGVLVLYDEAVKDMAAIEDELMRIGTFYTDVYEERGTNPVRDGAPVDRVSLLMDLYESEVLFQDAKRKVLDCYVQAYTHTTDNREQRRLGQVIANVLSMRPRLDLSNQYFGESYTSDVVCMELLATFLREVVEDCLSQESRLTAWVYRGLDHTTHMFGLPDPPLSGPSASAATLRLCSSCTPSSLFEFHSSLAVLGRLPCLLNHVLDTFVAYLRPQSPLAISTIQRILLQHALVEWKLLVAEDRLERPSTPAMGTSSLTQAKDPTADQNGIAAEFANVAFNLAEDPATLEFIAKQVVATTHSDAAALKPKFARHMANVLSQGGSSLDLNIGIAAYAWVAEFVRLREDLMRALFETEILSNVYKLQALQLGRDVHNIELKPIAFDDPHHRREDHEVEEDVVTMEEVSSVATEQRLRLAVSEIDQSMGNFDFHTLEGLQNSAAPSGLDDLRRALQVQVVQKNALIVAVQYNQVALDEITASMRGLEVSEGEKAVRFGSTGSKFGLTPRGPSATFVTANAPPALSIRRQPSSVSDILGGKGLDKLKADQVRLLRQELVRQAQPYFLSINARKMPIRNALLSAYAERSVKFAATPSAPEATTRKIKDLKSELVGVYCRDLMADMHGFSLKVQFVCMADHIRDAIRGLPNGGEPFVDGEVRGGIGDPSAPPPVEESQQNKEANNSAGNRGTRSIFTNGGDLASAWYLPTFREVLVVPRGDDSLYALSDAAYGLPLLSALHDIVVFLRISTQLSASSTHYLRDPDSAGADLTRFELQRLNTEIGNLRNPSHAPEVTLFLSERRQHLFLKLVLSLRTISTTFAASGNVTAWHHVERVLNILLHHRTPSSIYDTYVRHPMGFDFKQTRLIAASAPWVGSPKWPRYRPVDFGLPLLSDSDRNYVHAETISVDLLLDDVLQEEKVYSSSEPVRAVTLYLDFLRTAVSLTGLRHAFFASFFSTKPPHTVEEWKVAQEDYNLNVMALVQSFIAARAAHSKVGKRSIEWESRIAQLELVKGFVSVDLLKKTVGRLEESYGRLVSHVERHMPLEGLTPASFEDLSRKLQIARKLVSTIMMRSTSTRESGEVCYVLRAADLRSATDELCESLVEWGRSQQRERARSLQGLIDTLRHQLFISMSRISYLESLREADAKSMSQRIDVEVTDRAYNLIFENDSLKREVSSLKSNLSSLEQSIREQLNKEHGAQLSSLNAQLQMTKAQFSQYRRSVFQDVMSNMVDVKREALLKVLDNESATVEMKERTTALAGLEEEIASLRKANTDLRNEMTEMKTTFDIRLQTLTENHDRETQQLREECITANKKVWLSKEEVEERVNVLRNQLDNTRAALTGTQAELDNAKKELEMLHRNKTNLVHWKVSNARHLAELEQRVKKYEQWNTVDVDKLLLELARKESQLKQLTDIEARAAQRQRLQDEKSQQEVKRLRAVLAKERHVKAEALSKLGALQADDPLLAPFDPLPDASMHDLLSSSQQIAISLAHDNNELRRLLSYHHISPPPPLPPPDATLRPLTAWSTPDLHSTQLSTGNLMRNSTSGSSITSDSATRTLTSSSGYRRPPLSTSTKDKRDGSRMRTEVSMATYMQAEATGANRSRASDILTPTPSNRSSYPSLPQRPRPLTATDGGGGYTESA